MNKLSILHVVKNFCSPTQTFIHDLIAGLAQNSDTKQDVLCYKRKNLKGCGAALAVHSHAELEQKRLSVMERAVLSLARDRKRCLALKRFLVSEKPDLIHAHFAWTTWDYLCPTYLNADLDIPMVISTHGTDITSSAKGERAKEVLEALAKRNNVLFSGTSEFMAKLINDIGVPDSKIRLIPNAVNPMFFQNRKLESCKRRNGFRIINNSRMVEWKGHRYLIEAFARFVDECCDSAVLTLIGDGALKPELIALTEALGVSDKIHFLGEVDHNQIPNLLLEHDLYVQPSIIDPYTGQLETFGIAPLEAIAVGLPVIVSDTGGLPYVVGGSSRFARIVAPADVDQLYKEIAEIYRSEICYLSNKDYAEKLVKRFSLSSQLESCLGIYEELTNGGIS